MDAISATESVLSIMPTHVTKNIQMAPADPPFRVEIPATLVVGSAVYVSSPCLLPFMPESFT